MTTFTKTAVTVAESSYYAEQYAMGNLAKPSAVKQAKLDWEMAHKLDLAGDRYKAQGKLESAQACYSRALALATKAHNATT